MFLPFLKNPFLSPRFSREDFRDLMAGHLSRLTSQNQEGRYTAQISSLQPHHTTYARFLAEQSEAIGEQLGSTGEVQQLLADFQAFAKNELLVDVEYQFKRKKPNAAALTEFLPKGRKEYNKATLLTLPTLLERTATLTQKFKAELGPTWLPRPPPYKPPTPPPATPRARAKGPCKTTASRKKSYAKPPPASSSSTCWSKSSCISTSLTR
ncbi:hypothetical protein [Hymenobacter cellulosilyticus]|uniref:Uncharacterized protein n=1 Tax=Hymenobacter cellulosilyticus TaxID=2932248 RepID=A0A8T9Q3Z1_9BACT|nr:hypothetical protein [Hymenobacter cellulosilyticus]UOQ71775.1 hypothetical protein MUN79_24750 [Hymenobacter cellulosilyticus]